MTSVSLLLKRAKAVGNVGRTAVISNQQHYTYEVILDAAEKLQGRLAQVLPATTQRSAAPRVGLYAAPGPEYVAATWAVWQAGGIVVPLATSHPPAEISYVCEDAGVAAVLAPADQEAKLGPLARQHGAAMHVLEPLQGVALPHRQSCINAAGTGALDVFSTLASAHHQQAGVEQITHDGAWLEFQSALKGPLGGDAGGQGALIIYTSGTTGKPKGVLHTHRSLAAQTCSLLHAWRMGPSDHLLHCLPLHHVHGIVNALYCPLAAGGVLEVVPGGRFTPSAVWKRLMSGDVNVLMGVPTMYSKLLAHYDTSMDDDARAHAQKAAGALRLAVCGSSACPVPVMQRWHEVSGQMLLERYGMTETGMVLSNPYVGERRPGSVGLPMPGADVKVDESGQLRVRGPGVFSEYWQRQEATAQAFDSEGYFLTGDTASQRGEPPYYCIDGRTSVDIIKSGGYKISALQIESVVLQHPAISEAAVLGMPDESYGEVVTALVASHSAEGRPPLAMLQRLSREQLASYQVPRKWYWIESLPRNAMGKVNKKELMQALMDGTLVIQPVA